MLIEHCDATVRTAHRATGGRERACCNPQKRGLARTVRASDGNSLWAAMFDRPWSELSLADIDSDARERHDLRAGRQAARQQRDGQRR
jgi:hypothetical protein